MGGIPYWSQFLWCRRHLDATIPLSCIVGLFSATFHFNFQNGFSNFPLNHSISKPSSVNTPYHHHFQHLWPCLSERVSALDGRCYREWSRLLPTNALLFVQSSTKVYITVLKSISLCTTQWEVPTTDLNSAVLNSTSVLRTVLDMERIWEGAHIRSRAYRKGILA